MKHLEIVAALNRHSELFELSEQVASQHTDLLLHVTNAYLELLQQLNQQKKVISAQGNLINGCMERIMQLEGRCILGDFNQRLEYLEANKGKYYAINEEQLPKMLEDVATRVDALEAWLYTHDYRYFQEEEEKA